MQGRIVIVNHGTEPMKDIVVADMLSDCLIPLRVETSRGIISFSPPQLTVRLGAIKPGQKVEILITALVWGNGDGPVELDGSPSWYQEGNLREAN
ncbi:MAG: hypothetical protein L6435_13755 [Anaerolineae bacterium]|nr:hypothetical protein [Anaerolineae bacterium]